MTEKHSGMRRTIGLFGGTFDPVHNGHLRMALEAGEELALEQVRLLPCHRPPHRETPNVDSDQRTHMLRLAVESCPLLKLDDRELRRDGPSYTLETLQSLRAELGPEVSLVWIMGSDSFLGLESWHCWRELLDYAHLLVVTRPGWELPGEGVLHDWLLEHRAEPRSLEATPAGSVLVRSLRLLPISATEIRQIIAGGQSPQFLLPESVWQYVQKRRLYHP